MWCSVENKDLITLTEVAERSKSNTYQIGEIKSEIKEIKSEQKALYDLTSSVRLIASDMSKVNESLDEVKQGQKDLTIKMDTQISEVKGQIEKVDSKSKVDIWELFKAKAIPFLFGGGCIYGLIELIKSLMK